MSLTVDIKGLPALNRNLQRLAKRYPRAAAQAIHDEALEIFEESQILVPIDTGMLQLSGYVSEPEFGVTGNVTVEIGYGTKEGGDVDYAVIVHEGPDKNWQSSFASNKYLEKPFKAAVQGMVRRLADIIKDEVGV